MTAAACQAFFLKDLGATGAGGLQNSDNLVRIAEVRDLMNGQGWFDLMQYRLGPAPGLEMHWSRLVDAPLAALIWLGDRFSAGSGEIFAAFAWPALLTFCSIFAILYGFRRLSPGAPLLAACVIGGFSLFGGGVFQPGSFDHHNIQTALSLWTIALLLPGPKSARNHVLASICVAAMLAIGMETLPYAVAAAAYCAFSLLIDDDGDAARNARGFGLGLAAGVAALFAVLVGPGHYSSKACDSFSSFHLVMAGAGGLMLAALAQFSLRVRLETALGQPSAVSKQPLTPRSRMSRALGLALVAAFALGLAALLFPHCLADPLASMDPRLRRFWLDGVVEAQSISALFARDPFMLPGLFGLPLVALIVSVRAVATGDRVRAHALFCLMLMSALLVTCWQMRGALFGLPFAAIPLAAWVSGISARQTKGGSPVKLLFAWIVSISLFWGQLGSWGGKLIAGAPPLVERASASSAGCGEPALLAPLTSEPAGTVLAGTNFGALVLKFTQHRAIAGPYHRNAAGNLALIEAMTGTPEAARGIMHDLGVTLLAACPSGADEKDFVNAAPGGFLNLLFQGARYDWLEPVEAPASNPLRFWRVKA